LSRRGTSTFGRLGLALAALAVAAVFLAPTASAAEPGQISGKVTLAAGGADVLGAEVCAESQTEEAFECDLTAADGSYEIVGLPAGNYIVGFTAGESGQFLIRQFWSGVSSYGEATAVPVAAGATTPGINAAMALGGAISGMVVDAANGLPISEVEVCSWSEPGGGFDGCDFTASNGTYEIVGVPPGLHEVEFWAFEGNYEPRFINAVSVSTGLRTTNVNAALVREAVPDGRISGHVYAAATKAPLGGIAVCAIDESGESRGCAHTGKAGNYEFLQVPAGAWRVAFSPDPSEFKSLTANEIQSDIWPSQFWNLKPTLAQADPIGIGHGTVVTGIDALLGPGPNPPPPPPPSPGGSSTPPATSPAPVVVTAVKPKPLHCGKGKVKKQVKGKARCVKRHKHHRRLHRHGQS
jgi:hypothetical protein